MTQKKTTTKKECPAPVFQNIRGKNYETVASRVKRFRFMYPTYSLISEILVMDEQHIIILAKVKDEKGRVISDGLAEEVRGAGMINKTSALENGETSAWGRALGNLGIDESGSVATADEVRNAIKQQDQPSEEKPKPEPKPKPSTDEPRMATDRQLTSIRQQFKGLDTNGAVAMKAILLDSTGIEVPDGKTLETLLLKDIANLITEEGATNFLSRPF